MTPVDTGGRRLAVLVHDPALDEDPGLVAAGVAVTRLAIDNERLSLEISRQLEEVRASRARIVEAGDAERRRIERDLHDGVQQRLVALAMALRRAAGETERDRRRVGRCGAGADEALVVVEDVRELARGIHPAVLTEAGLKPALQALADRSPVPVELDIDLRTESTERPPRRPTSWPRKRWPTSPSTRARRRSGWRHGRRRSPADVRIDDDGVGGADPTGSGLRGLADRVAASGGTFAVDGTARWWHAVRRDSARLMAVRVVVAEDSVLLREGIVRLLRDEGFDVCGQAGDADELLRLSTTTARYRDRRHPDAARSRRRRDPRPTQAIRRSARRGGRVLVLSQYVEPDSRCGFSRTAGAASDTC